MVAIVLFPLIVFLVWAMFKQRKENFKNAEPWEYRERSSAGQMKPKNRKK